VLPKPSSPRFLRKLGIFGGIAGLFLLWTHNVVRVRVVVQWTTEDLMSYFVFMY
jgi:hypothetical protein